MLCIRYIPRIVQWHIEASALPTNISENKRPDRPHSQASLTSGVRESIITGHDLVILASKWWSQDLGGGAQHELHALLKARHVPISHTITEIYQKEGHNHIFKTA